MNSLATRLRVYLVTDRHRVGSLSLAEAVEEALAGGVRAVQLREKDLTTRDLLAVALDLRARTTRHGALLLINDRPDVALACGADGVHLPTHGFPVADARAILGPQSVIGVSTHSAAEAADAARQGADFVVFGPVYATPSKEPYGPPRGLDELETAVREASVPVVALGGIDASRVPEVRTRGAAGIALIRAILAAPSVRSAAARLVAAMQN